jgi:hypothetical protein
MCDNLNRAALAGVQSMVTVHEVASRQYVVVRDSERITSVYRSTEVVRNRHQASHLANPRGPLKADRPHRVPLSDAAIEILIALAGNSTPAKRDYVFAEPTDRPQEGEDR